MLYFAYGSNICTGRLQRRAPSATFVRTARVMGHSFRFHKRSSDDSAKADAFETSNPPDFVWGVIFDIDEREKSALDHAEGVGFGYREKMGILLDKGGQEHRAFLYVADANSI